MAAAIVTDEMAETFQRDGAVPLRGVFSEDWLDLLRAGVAEDMANPSKLSKDYARPGQGRFFTDHHMHRRLEAFRKFTHEGPAAEICARLMGSSKVNLFDEHLLVKEPGTENPTYWHQDLPYFEMTGVQICSMWIPLDPVTRESGALKFVLGSHRWGKLFRPIRIGVGDRVEEAEAYDGDAPDIDATPENYEIASWDYAPGDCVVFHGAILHGAWPNLTPDRRRRALAVRFAGDDVRWQPRDYIPSVPDRPDLEAGGPIDCDLYPVIWRA
jgi:ectoine hydroxylase-related dioxygenase (phytanoyl-CoA dioxygenase family)